MFWFMLGISTIFAACMGTNAVLDSAFRPDNPWVLIFLLNTCVVPVALAWGTAELVQLLTPRGVFASGRSRAGQLARGLFAGLLGLSFAFCGLVTPDLVNRWSSHYVQTPSDLMLSCGGAFAGVLVVMLCARRWRPGVCARCRYDLSGLTPAAGNKCPECGTAVGAR